MTGFPERRNDHLRFDFVKLCGIKTENNFCTTQWSCNIFYMLMELMPNVASISQYVVSRPWIISFSTASMFIGAISDLRWHALFSLVSERRPQFNTSSTSASHWQRIVLHCQRCQLIIDFETRSELTPVFRWVTSFKSMQTTPFEFK